MSCPNWEDCSIKSCIENEHCRNKVFWNSEVGLQRRKVIRKIKLEEKTVVFDPENPCSKKHNICDKRKACELLGQCVFSIRAIKGNIKVITELSGKKSILEIIKILAKHNPKPMRSYYLNKKD